MTVTMPPFFTSGYEVENKQIVQVTNNLWGADAALKLKLLAFNSLYLSWHLTCGPEVGMNARGL